MRQKTQDELKTVAIQILGRMHKDFSLDFPPGAIAEIAEQLAMEKISKEIENALCDLTPSELTIVASEMRFMESAKSKRKSKKLRA